MGYSDIKKNVRIVSLSILLFAIISFVHSSSVFADTEQISPDGTVTGIVINPNSNVFVSNQGSTRHTGYVSVDKDYIYYIKNTSSSTPVYIASSNEIPSLGGTYNFIYTLDVGNTYTYRPTGDYLYFDFTTNVTNSYPLITREKLGSMGSAVNDLVDNVGVNNLWSVFEIAIDYIWVVVLVAFGIFIITRLIMRLSRGKEGM